MSTPPGPPPPSAPPPSQPYYGGMPALPIVSGELIVFLLVWVVMAIVTLAAKTVDSIDFVQWSVVLAAAYMLSRGIAKAGKVLEGR